MPKQKTIKIDVEDQIPRFEFEQLQPLQGNLKNLSETDFGKLRESILGKGFFAPLFLWSNGKTLKILDGHQRVRVLGKLKEEGYEIPPIPGVALRAKNEKEAKEKLLAVTSQYGKIDKQGLYEFLEGLDEQLLVTEFDFAGLDSLKFLDEFYVDGEALDTEAPPVGGTLASVGGQGVKMLQLYFTEADHAKIIQQLGQLQDAYATENATDTIKEALRRAVQTVQG